MSGGATDSAILVTEELVAGYLPDVDVINGVSLSVNQGEIVTLIGPNGAGKSTLLKTIFGLLKPRRGRITFQGEDIGGKRPHTITRKGLAYVPQLDNVFPSLTAQENLEIGSLERSATRRRIAEIYDLFPRLGERRDQVVGTMSGGERQLVAMALALMSDPEAMLLDEPSAGLAPTFVETIFQKIEDINRIGVTLVMVEQNARRALSMSDRGYVLDMGANRFHGAGRELLEDQNVAELYLGGTARIDRPEIATSEEGGAAGT